MAAEALPLTTIGIIILISIVFSIFIRKLGQNEVIGFIVAGFLLGPFFLGFLHPDDQLVVGFAELGLFVLLFYLGIELSLKEFLAAGSTIFGFAIIDMLLTSGIGAFVMLSLGYSPLLAVIIGVMIFCTSTAVVGKFMITHDMESNAAAKNVHSILILQDFLGILLLVLVTSSSPGTSILGLAGDAVAFAVAAFFAVYHLSRIVEQWMKANGFGHTEITLYALGVGLVCATLANVIGLSTAIGAYFAGFALSETESGQRIKKDVGFLRDFFLVFFFFGFGTSLFYDPEAKAIALPSADVLLYLAAIALVLAIVAIIAHALTARVLGKVFNISPEDSSLMAILLTPLGEFLVIIVTVTGGILSGAEKAFLGPLAFMLILITIFIFQPLYNRRQLHREFFSKIPQIPRPVGFSHATQASYAMKQAQEAALNFFVVLCFAWVSVLFFEELPNFGVPIVHSREVTSVLLFIFFAIVPLRRGISAFSRLIHALMGKTPVPQIHETIAPTPPVPSVQAALKRVKGKSSSGRNAKGKKRRKK